MQYIDLKSLGNGELIGDAQHLDYAAADYFEIVPLKTCDKDIVTFATQKEMDVETYLKLRFLLKKELLFCKVDGDVYTSLLKNTWSDEQKKSDVRFTKKDSFKAKVFSDYKNGNEKGVTRINLEDTHAGIPAIQFVDDIFSRAISAGASDIHLEPGEGSLGVRFRLDGVLQPALKIEKSRQDELISRLKILAKMDIAEKRRPQDGRIIVEGRRRNIDVRVSSMPTPHGEKIVLRLLDKSRQPLELKALGLTGRNYDLFREAIRKPHGMILVTGPTGSGKTTTLYAAIKDILSPRINISTVEDPIEYQIEGINQTQMHSAIDYTFAQAVRTFLRQDPDVIMIGEIRDPETAKYAIQASQTGHMVFSTLHTNDAPSAVIRLLEMEMEPFLVASTVHLIMAQRLIRKVCDNCSFIRSLNEDEKEYCDKHNIEISEIKTGKGCVNCADTGYRGRIGVFEIMPVTPEIQELVTEKRSTQIIREKALEQGMRCLKDEGMRLVKDGISTLEEVKCVLG